MKKVYSFQKGFESINGEIVSLSLIDTYGAKTSLPFYWWNIVINNRNVGKISLRIADNKDAYWDGNIGYEIDEDYRGHNYAYEACKLVIEIAKKHNMDQLYFSCEPNNIPSIRTIEKLGAIFLEENIPSKDYVYYRRGICKHRIYVLKLV